MSTIDVRIYQKVFKNDYYSIWLNIMSIVIIFFISKPAIKALKDYETQKQLNVEKYSFDPASLGIENAEFWDKRSKETKKTS